MKRIWKDYFTFSKKERIAAIALLLLIALFIAAPYFYPVKHSPPVLSKALRDFVKDSKATQLSQDSMAEPRESFNVSKYANEPLSFVLFPFDPNTISEREWKRLGISDKTIHTLLNYRNKGGRFKSPEDIRKIWGMKKEVADRIIPYVKIAETVSSPYPTKKIGISNPQPSIIDINTATIEDWKSLPGIGEVLANRIMKYRERMGGFTNEAQVKTTYGISDSVFRLIAPYLRTVSETIQKINLNTISAYELRIRANIPDAVARAIIAYRQQYGPYQSVNDLKKIVFISDSLFQKIVGQVKVD